jgi:hypothetical protein
MMPALLSDYLKRTQRLIHDTKQELVDPEDLIDYINDARREVAMRSQCVRILPPITGSLTRLEIQSPGTGYTNPVISISSPDCPGGKPPYPNGDQAVAGTPFVDPGTGAILTAPLTYGGHGYFQPTVTLTDPTGTGAVITPVMTPLCLILPGQEVYPLSDIDLAPFPGVASIYTVRSVSLLYTNYRYSLAVYDFSTYQAMIRQYSGGSYQYVPCWASVFGRGTDLSLYMYPLPSQVYQLELDCSCLPQDLTDLHSVEIIPDPWTDAVPYWAARMAFLELQNHNSARAMEDMFDRRMARFGSYVDKGRAVNPYGRA